MYLVISLLVLRAGYGIGLYQFLIIAYLFTFAISVLSFFVYRHGICILRIVSLRLTIVNRSDFKFMASVMMIPTPSCE